MNEKHDKYLEFIRQSGGALQDTLHQAIRDSHAQAEEVSKALIQLEAEDEALFNSLNQNLADQRDTSKWIANSWNIYISQRHLSTPLFFALGKFYTPFTGQVEWGGTLYRLHVFQDRMMYIHAPGEPTSHVIAHKDLLNIETLKEFILKVKVGQINPVMIDFALGKSGSGEFILLQKSVVQVYSSILYTAPSFNHGCKNPLRVTHDGFSLAYILDAAHISCMKTSNGEIQQFTNDAGADTPFFPLPKGFDQAIGLGLLPNQHGGDAHAQMAVVHNSKRILTTLTRQMGILFGDEKSKEKGVHTLPMAVNYFRDFSLQCWVFIPESTTEQAADVVLIGGYRLLELCYRPSNKGLVIRWNHDDVSNLHTPEERVFPDFFKDAHKKWIDISLSHEAGADVLDPGFIHIYTTGRKSSGKMPRACPPDPTHPLFGKMCIHRYKASHENDGSFALLDLRFFAKSFKEGEFPPMDRLLTHNDALDTWKLVANYRMDAQLNPMDAFSTEKRPHGPYNICNPHEQITGEIAFFTPPPNTAFPLQRFIEIYPTPEDRGAPGRITAIRVCRTSGQLFYLKRTKTAYTLHMTCAAGTSPHYTLGNTGLQKDEEGLDVSFGDSTVQGLEQTLLSTESNFRQLHFKYAMACAQIHHMIAHSNQTVGNKMKGIVDARLDDGAENYAAGRAQFLEERPVHLSNDISEKQAALKSMRNARMEAHEHLIRTHREVNALRRAHFNSDEYTP